MSVTSVLNNRETAAVIWLMIFLVWALSKRTIRSSFLAVLKALFAKKIILLTISMFVYILLMVLAFEKVGFWDASAMKDTILWVFGVAFIMLVNSNRVVNAEHYFRKTISDSIRLVLVLEFLVNLYSFNLVSELVIVPIVSLVVMMNAIAGLKPEHKQVKVFLDYALALFGIVLIILTLHKIVVDFQNFATLKNLRDFLLPPLFTTAFLPFVYLTALFMKYEDIFARIDIANTNSELAGYAKRRILAACHFDLWKLNKFAKEARMLRVSNKDDVLVLIQKCKNR